VVSLCFAALLYAQIKTVRRVETEILSVRVDKPAKNVWIALNEKKEKLYKDHSPYGSFLDSAEGFGPIYYSPDKHHIAIKINNEGKHFLIIDGKRGNSYDEISDITFSPDSTQVGYVAAIGKKHMIVINGKAGNQFDKIDTMGIFSPDGKHAAFRAYRDSKSFIVVDGKEGKQYDCMCGPKFSPDSKQITYMAMIGKKECIVIDDKEGKLYDAVDLPSFSSDGKHFAYEAKENKKSFVVIDGKEMKRYDKVANTVVSPDNKRIAYIALEGWKWFVVVDGNEGKHYFQYGENHTRGDINFGVDRKGVENIEKIGPIFSPDGTHLAYVANDGMKRFVVIDGKEQKQYDYVNNIVFSPDSKHLAYAAIENKKNIIVVDGKEGEQYSMDFFSCAEGLQFSPDSKHIVYICSEINKEGSIVYYGMKLKEEYHIIKAVGRNAAKTIMFDSSDSFHYLAVKYLYHDEYEAAYKIYLVEQRMK
jgi:WD40 repeat protein